VAAVKDAGGELALTLQLLPLLLVRVWCPPSACELANSRQQYWHSNLRLSTTGRPSSCGGGGCATM